jgi:hypothetical protein
VGRVQVPGKPQLLTKEPPPEEDIKELQRMESDLTGDQPSPSFL